MTTTTTFNRGLDAWLEPPDEVWPMCTCRHSQEDHNGLPDDTGCTVCGDCESFTEYDDYQAAEDHEFELADIAWKERDR